MVAVTYGSARTATAPKARAPERNGFFARMLDAMMEARLRQAYRELELHQHLWHRDVEQAESEELPFGR